MVKSGSLLAKEFLVPSDILSSYDLAERYSKAIVFADSAIQEAKETIARSEGIISESRAMVNHPPILYKKPPTRIARPQRIKPHR
jgi:hypothetical protein